MRTLLEVDRMIESIWKLIGFIGVFLLILFVETPMNVTAANMNRIVDSNVVVHHFLEFELESIRFDLFGEGDTPYVVIRNTSEDNVRDFIVFMAITVGSDIIHTSAQTNLNASAGQGIILPLGLRADSLPNGRYTLFISVFYEDESTIWERRFQVEEGVWGTVERRLSGTLFGVIPQDTFVGIIVSLLIIISIITYRRRVKNTENNHLPDNQEEQ